MLRTVTLAIVMVWATAASPSTLDSVIDRDELLCGVADDVPGFSENPAVGPWRGFHVDYCRAVAAAVLGDGSAVTFVPLADRDRFDALLNGDVDLLSRHTEWTMSRETSLGLSFAAITYYDGQGIMTPLETGVTSAIELSGSPICVESGTLAELDLGRFFARNDMTLDAVVFETLDEAVSAYASGRCRALSATYAALHAIRADQERPREHAILPDVLSRKPVGLVVRGDDDAWKTIVRWVHFALVTAEALDVTSATVGAMADGDDEDVRRLLGADGALAEGLGLAPDWAARMVGEVGNYAEIFERNLGAETRLRMERGLNALWNAGGLQYAPPIR